MDRLKIIFIATALILGGLFVWFSSNFFYTLFWAVLEKWNFKEANVVAYTLAHLTPFVLIILVVMAVYFIARHEIDKQITSVPRNPKIDVQEVRDVWLYDAICRMFLGRWEKIQIIDGHLDLSRSAFQSIHDLITQVKQLAFDDRLPIWGKAQGHLAMWEKPKPDFWKNYQIDYLSFTDGDPKKLRVVPYNTNGQITSLRDLMTSRAAIEKICRDPSVNLPTNDANSLVVFTGKGEPFDKIEVNQHGIHRTIFIGVKNVGSKKVSNCNFYRIYLAFTNVSQKTLLDGPFSLDPNETRYVSIAMFNETRDTPNIEHLIGLSSHPAAFGAGVTPPRLTTTGHHAVSFAVESTDTRHAVLHCELWTDEAGKLRLEPV